MKAKRSCSRIVGYEILRRVGREEAQGHPIDSQRTRGVLGAQGKHYLVPPGIDLFELGIIVLAGPYELLPIDRDDKPRWDEVIHVLVSSSQAERQRELLFRSHRALCRMIREADELEASIAEWSLRREAHPVFGMLRLATIDVWASMRGGGPLDDRKLAILHEEVARRVAARIRAHLIG